MTYRGLQVILSKMTSLFPFGHFIQWTLVNAVDSGSYSFDLYRAGGPNGPWEPITMGLLNQYSFIDRFHQPSQTNPTIYLKPNQLRLFRNFYYRVVVTSPTGEVVEAVDEVGPILLAPGVPLSDRKMAQHYRKGLRDFRLTLKFNGTPVALLKKRIWGTRCTMCFDKYTKEVIRAACVTCYGTGFVGGYWAPTLIYARRGAAQGTSQITPEQISDASEARIWMPDIPAMERDDIVVFMADQRRYRIDQQTQTEIKLTPLHQVFTAQELAHDNVIYKFAVNTQNIEPLF